MLATHAQIQDHWEELYKSTSTPFDLEAPDEWIASLAVAGKISGAVLDAGCGPGRTALFLAGMGYSVLGVDLSANAIERAKRKAVAQNSSAQFLQANICRLSGYDKDFDTVIDIGCFHSLPDEDRSRYAAALHWACRPGAALYLRAFSDQNPDHEVTASGLKAPAISEEQLRSAFFSNGWTISQLTGREVELNIPGKQQNPTSHCWFAEMHAS